MDNQIDVNNKTASSQFTKLTLLTEFFEHLQEVKKYSKNTLIAYKCDLLLYDKFKEAGELPLESFFKYMEQKDLSLRSQARAISSLRSYFKFLESKGLNVVQELKVFQPLKISHTTPKRMTSDDFDKIVKSAKLVEPVKKIRNEVLLLLLFSSGCRVSEFVSLNIEDFSLSQKQIQILTKEKGYRFITLSSDLSVLMNQYIIEARPKLVPEGKVSENALFLNDRGNRATRVDVWRWLATWSKKAGLAEPLHPHQFRHGYAMALIENGTDPKSIRTLLGHKSIQSIKMYTASSDFKKNNSSEDSN